MNKRSDSAVPRIILIGAGSLGCYIASKVFDSVPEHLTLILLHRHASLRQLHDNAATFILEQNELNPLDKQVLQQHIRQADLVFLTGATGGRSGRLLTMLARLCCDQKKPVIGFVIYPFSFEGQPRIQTARACIQQLETSCNSLLVLPNDQLGNVLGKNSSLDQALDASNQYLLQLIRRLLQIVSEPASLHIGFNDFLALIQYGGMLNIGFASGKVDGSLSLLLQQALQSPLLRYLPLNTVSKALLHIHAGQQLQLAQLTQLSEQLAEKLPAAQQINAGVTITPNSDKLEVMVVISQ